MARRFAVSRGAAWVLHRVTGLSKTRTAAKTAKSPYGSRSFILGLGDNEAVKADRGQKWAEKRLDRARFCRNPRPPNGASEEGRNNHDLVDLAPWACSRMLAAFAGMQSVEYGRGHTVSCLFRAKVA